MSNHRLAVLAVDDELPQLEDLARILRKSPEVEKVETASNGQDAITQASQRPYDAVFLDVRMPGLDGLELARVLNAFALRPAVVFVSAYDVPAGDAFELRALDYLMKPVTAARVRRALTRIVMMRAGEGRARAPKLEPREPVVKPDWPAVEAGGLAVQPGGPAPADSWPDNGVFAVPGTNGGQVRLLPYSLILYFKAYGDYLRVVTDVDRYLVRGRIAELERRLRRHGFVRVHRQYLVNLRDVEEIRPLPNAAAQLRFKDGSCVPVARRRVAELRRILHT